MRRPSEGMDLELISELSTADRSLTHPTYAYLRVTVWHISASER